MNDIRSWLQQRGLGKYAESFEENELTVELLGDLTNEDLRELGLPMGPRKQFLKLVKEQSFAESDDATPGPQTTLAGEAERRQLTVVFADLAGSTELSLDLDPEDLRRLNRSFQDAAKASVERFGGYVARYMGDGVLAYFGYPVAHEDAPARAMLAGLDLIPAVSRIEGPQRLAVRVGVATGTVVVGDIVGEGASQESAVVGETPNLAARLQSLAEPGTVVASLDAVKLAPGLFETEDLGARELKGFKAPIQAYRVARALQIQSRFAARARSMTPLIGRADELNLLLRRWAQAKQGEGRFVFLGGDPGVGKSRLLEELYGATKADERVAIRCQCSPHASNTPFLPIVQHIERAAGILTEDDAQIRLSKLATFVVQRGANAALTPLLASLLSLPIEALADLAPRRRRDLAIDGVIDDVIRLSRERPVLFVLEDAHWADASTLEVVERLMAASESHRLLAVITHRPEFSAPWAAQGTNTQIFLNRLGRRETRELVDSIAGLDDVDDGTVEQIVSRCDGVPLFAEELAKGALAHSAGEIPVTLHDFLMARLDRLGHAREVAQTAACIGREFSPGLLAEVLNMTQERVDVALEALVHAEIVYPHHRYGVTSHIFKHALLRDAAYESLLLEKRRPIHLRIAQSLDTGTRDIVPASTDLAHHYELAGESGRAVEHFTAAGDAALAAFSVPEALASYGRAIEVLDGADDQAEISIRLKMARAHYSVSSFDRAWQDAGVAASLAARVGSEILEGQAVASMAQSSLFGHQMARCQVECERALQLSASAENDSKIAALAWSVQTLLAVCEGRLGDVNANVETALSHCHIAQDKDSEALVRVCEALCPNWTGDFAVATELATRATAVARAASSNTPLVIALYVQSLPLVGAGRYDAAFKTLREGIQLSERLGEEFQYIRYFNTTGWLKLEIGALADALEFNQRGLEIALRRRDPETTSNCLLNIADVHLADGDVELATEFLREAYGIVHKASTSDWMKWRYSMHLLASYGEAKFAQGDLSAADELCRQCLEAATAKDSKKYLARAWRLKAELTKARQNWDEARKAIARSLSYSTKVGNPTQLWRTHLARAEILGEVGEAEASGAAYLSASGTIESIGASLTTPELKRLFENSSLFREIRTTIDNVR